jgi:hypothetical protein
MLFHFDFGNWWRMVSLAWREESPRARRRYLWVLLAWVPLVAALHAVCFALDALLFPSLRRVRVRAPVFVIGHARSGTTLIHRLLSRDAGRFSAFMLYELYFPSLLQKKLIRAAARIDRRWLGGALARRVHAWEERRYAGMQGVHEMSLTHFEEDDIALYYSCASGFWITKLPYMGELDFYHVDAWPPARRRRLMRFYRECIRRQLALAGGERIHLSKNPVFAGRVESLIEAFPDARFVIPLRNPYETIPSLLKLMRRSWRRLRWSEERQRRCLAVLAEQSFETYLHPLEVLARHPETRHAVVDYRDAVEDPAKAIEGVYQRLGLPMSDAYRGLLREESRRARTHAADHAYSLEEFGLDKDAIHTRLADLFRSYHWDAGAVAPAAAAPAPRGEGV